MPALTQEQVSLWLAQQPNLVVDGVEVRFRRSKIPELHFHNPTGEGQLAYFARALTCLHHEESMFAGGLLWITGWGVWSSWVEDVGRKAFSMLRGDEAGLALFKQAPGQRFSEDELLASVAFLVQPILIGWDAWYCPIFKNQETDFIVRISHDAYVNVIPATLETRKQIQNRLKDTAIQEAAN